MANGKQMVRRHFEEVWSQGKFDRFEELYDPGYESYDPLVGKFDRSKVKAVVSTYRRAFPDLKMEVLDVLQDGQKFAVRWRATGTHRGEFMGLPPTGKPGSIVGVSIIETRDGKMVRDYFEFDQLGLLRQLGMQLPLQLQPAGPGAPAPMH